MGSLRWGRHPPAGANSQHAVVILQRCTKNGVYQICNTHVANVQQCMQKKSGGISAPAISFFIHCHILTMNTFSACTENGSRFATELLHAQTTSTFFAMMFFPCNDCKRMRIALSAR